MQMRRKKATTGSERAFGLRRGHRSRDGARDRAKARDERRLRWMATRLTNGLAETLLLSHALSLVVWGSLNSACSLGRLTRLGLNIRHSHTHQLWGLGTRKLRESMGNRESGNNGLSEIPLIGWSTKRRKGKLPFPSGTKCQDSQWCSDKDREYLKRGEGYCSSGWLVLEKSGGDFRLCAWNFA